MNGVSIGHHSSRCLVWLIDQFEFTDLPELQSVKLGNVAFGLCYSVVFESNWMIELMNQIYQSYNLFNLVKRLFLVMVVVNDRRLRKNPTTSRTH